MIIVSRPDLFPKPMAIIHKLLKINILISIYLTSSGLKAKGGRTENDGAVYPEL